MIEQVHIQNFKCLRDVKVDLAPLTVFIGPNNSGKTSLLEGLSLLGKTTAKPIVGKDSAFGAKIDSAIVWRRSPILPISWKVLLYNSHDASLEKFEYQLTLSNFSVRSRNDVRELLKQDGNVLWETAGDALGSSVSLLADRAARHTAPERVIARCIQTSLIYKFDPAASRRPCRPVGGLLNARGDNLAAVLDGLLTGPERAAFNDLEKVLTATFPDLAGIALPSDRMKFVDSDGEAVRRLVKRIEFVLAGSERPKIAIPANAISDGVMLLTAYLALAATDTPEIILLEEPENGLHPSRLKMVLDLLRQMTRGELGNKKRQILLTTHSPLLLNYCQKEEVRIVRRADDGGTEITPLAQVPDIDKLLGEFGIGELWNLLGEDGLLKDVVRPPRTDT